MALDAQALAKFAADTLEDLEADDDVPTNPTLADAHLIVEIRGSDHDGDPISQVHGFTMSGGNVAGIGLLVRALMASLDL